MKTLGTMLALGIALGWACVFAIPTLERAGVPPQVADALPVVGFALGLAWGLAIRRSASVRRLSGYVFAPLLVGAAFWFFAVLAGGVLIGLGLSPEAADRVPVIAFAIGAVLGAAPLLVLVAERRED